MMSDPFAISTAEASIPVLAGADADSFPEYLGKLEGIDITDGFGNLGHLKMRAAE